MDNRRVDIDKALREGAHPQAIRDFLSGAEAFDAGLKAGLDPKYDIYADNLKLTGADYDGDTIDS